MDNQSIIFHCPTDGVELQLLDAIQAAAAEYYAAAGEAIVVTAGLRTLQRQAELMAAFSKAQLEAMYCRHGYPSYISQILALPNPHDAAQVYQVLAHRTEGYISKHLYGKAIDISSAEISQPDLFKNICANHGLSVLDETECGVKCFHITIS